MGAAPRNTPASPAAPDAVRPRAGRAEVPGRAAGADRGRGRRACWRAGGDAGGPAPEPSRPAELADRDAPVGRAGGLDVRRFTRRVDTAWRRTSYSALTRRRVAEPLAASVAQRAGGASPRTTRRSTWPSSPASTAGPSPARRRVPDGRTCPWGPRSGRWCTRCSSTPTRRRPTSAPSCSRHIARAAGALAGDGRRDELADALVPVCDSPLGPLAPARTLRADRRCATGCARWTSSCRSPAATVRDYRPPGHPRRRGAVAAPPPPGGRPVRPYAEALSSTRPGRPEPARLPHRLGRRRAAGAQAGPPLPGRGLQDQLARRPDDAAAAPRTTTAPRRSRGHGPLRLPAAGAALRRRAAPVPALATARLRPRPPPRRRALPLPAGHVRPGHPARRRPARAASSPGSRRRPWSRSCPTCSTARACRRHRRARARSSADGEHDRRLAAGRRRACSASFNGPGCSTSSDVHVATRVGRLAGESDERVLLAAALAVRAVRHGSVCVDLATVPDSPPSCRWPADRDAVADRAWPAVAAGRAGGVLRLEFDLLYLDRYWRQEGQVCRRPAGRAWRHAAPDVDAGGARRRARAGLPRCDVRRAAGRRVAGACAQLHDRAHRRSRHRQDHHRRADCWPCSPSSRSRRAAAAAHRPDRADRQGRRAAPGGGRARAPAASPAGGPRPARPARAR